MNVLEGDEQIREYPTHGRGYETQINLGLAAAVFVWITISSGYAGDTLGEAMAETWSRMLQGFAK